MCGGTVAAVFGTFVPVVRGGGRGEIPGMTTRSQSPDSSAGGRTFDRLLLLIGMVAVVTAFLAGMAAVRAGGDGASEPGTGTTTPRETPQDTPQVVTYTLNEFSITGPTEIPPGPTVFEVINEG